MVTMSKTRWHSDWQALAHPRLVEFQVGCCRRADVVTLTGCVIEFQHSGIPEAEIRDREAYYLQYASELLWVFDATDAFHAGRLTVYPRDGWVSFHWKHPRRSLLACQSPVLLDLGNGTLLHIRKRTLDTQLRGWGILRTQTEVQQWMTSASN